jgi:O-antigen/teichoic acid export membrane protein
MRSLIQTFRKDTFARNSLILFIGAMTANVVNYIFHFVLGRMVSIPIYGEAESLISLINLVSVPAAAITMIATMYGSIGKAEGNGFGTKAAMRNFQIQILWVGVPLFSIAILLTPYVKNFLHLSSTFSLYILWALVLVSFFSAITLGVMAGWQRFAESSVASVVGSVLKLISVLIFVQLGFAVNGIIGSFLLGGITTYVVSLYLLGFLGKQKSEKKKSLQLPPTTYIIPIFIMNLALAILGNIDVVFAKHNLDPIAAGQYGALSVVAKIIFFGTGAVASVLFAMAAEKKHQEVDSFGLFAKAVVVTMILAIFSITVYFAFPKVLLYVLYGKTYLSVAPYLGWLALAVSLYSFCNLALQYLLSLRETKIAYAYLATALLGGVLMWIFGKTISSMIAMVILSQALSAVLCLCFILAKVWSRRTRSSTLSPAFEPIIPTL